MKKLYNTLFVSAQINADDIQKMAENNVTLLINNRPDDEESGQLSHQDAEKVAHKVGIQYHYLPMKNGEPIDLAIVDEFYRLTHNCEKNTVIHCRSGMRSTILWAVGQIKQQHLTIDQTIQYANQAGIALEKIRPALESLTK